MELEEAVALIRREFGLDPHPPYPAPDGWRWHRCPRCRELWLVNAKKPANYRCRMTPGCIRGGRGQVDSQA